MFRLLLALSLASSAACAGRQVEVTTGPQPASAEVAIHMTNNLTQAVNVYVVSGGTDIFLKQVAANSTEHLPINGIAAGTTVGLRAVTVDGTRTYTRNSVTLNTMYEWQVP